MCNFWKLIQATYILFHDRVQGCLEIMSCHVEVVYTYAWMFMQDLSEYMHVYVSKRMKETKEGREREKKELALTKQSWK